MRLAGSAPVPFFPPATPLFLIYDRTGRQLLKSEPLPKFTEGGRSYYYPYLLPGGKEFAIFDGEEPVCIGMSCRRPNCRRDERKSKRLYKVQVVSRELQKWSIPKFATGQRVGTRCLPTLSTRRTSDMKRWIAAAIFLALTARGAVWFACG